MAEHDAWDINAGVVATMQQVSVGLYLTELEERKGSSALGAPAGTLPLAGFTKANLAISITGNLFDIVRGSRQRAEATDREVERLRLQREVKQRERRMLELARAIANASGDADAAATARRRALEKQLEAERDAVKKATQQLGTPRKPDGGAP